MKKAASNTPFALQGWIDSIATPGEIDPSDKRAGTSLVVKPEYGEGFCWYFYSPADGFAFIELNFTPASPLPPIPQDEGQFVVGILGKGLLELLGIQIESERMMRGLTFLQAAEDQVVPTHELQPSAQVTGIALVLTPQGIKRMSEICKVNPITLGLAIKELDRARCLPPIYFTLENCRTWRPTSQTASGYYFAKALEACAILTSWYQRTYEDTSAVLSDEDREALEIALDYIRNNLSSPITPKQLAEMTFMSESKLTKIFKAAREVPPREFIRNQRLTKAARLLRDTDLTLAQIADEIGYVHHSSFSEAFKTKFGVTPKEYRDA